MIFTETTIITGFILGWWSTPPASRVGVFTNQITPFSCHFLSVFCWAFRSRVLDVPQIALVDSPDGIPSRWVLEIFAVHSSSFCRSPSASERLLFSVPLSSERSKTSGGRTEPTTRDREKSSGPHRRSLERLRLWWLREILLGTLLTCLLGPFRRVEF